MIFRLSLLWFCLLCVPKLYADTELITDSGQKIAFSSLAGRWIFINYWASWCHTCLAEIKELNRFHDQYHDKIALFAVNFDMPAVDELHRLVNHIPINYPSLIQDPHTALKLSDIVGVPVTFVFNPQGKLTQTLYGLQTVSKLSKIIQK